MCLCIHKIIRDISADSTFCETHQLFCFLCLFVCFFYCCLFEKWFFSALGTHYPNQNTWFFTLHTVLIPCIVLFFRLKILILKWYQRTHINTQIQILRRKEREREKIEKPFLTDKDRRNLSSKISNNPLKKRKRNETGEKTSPKNFEGMQTYGDTIYNHFPHTIFTNITNIIERIDIKGAAKKCKRFSSWKHNNYNYYYHNSPS